MTVISSTSGKSSTNAYDAVPYESHPFKQSHPDRLATMATLFGMTPTPVEKCRVLELGCASGGNLIPMAYILPESHFVGVDFSGRQVLDGQNHIAALGLKNIELKQMNIMDVDSKLGLFDYIIVHGIYSWVPAAVQDKILQVCQDLLSPNGVAYISYNTYPGWHFRGIIRDMMLYHTASATEFDSSRTQPSDGGLLNTGALTGPPARARRARELMDFLAAAVPTENNAYGIMLQNEVQLVRNAQDSYFLHDHLEELNDPIYFHQFAERAASHGMQFLGEAEFSVMLSSNFGTQVHETLSRISNEIVRTEQYMDFVRNRAFRQTLLCRQGVVLNRNLKPQTLRPFFISIRPLKVLPEVNLGSTEPQTFEMDNNVTFNVGNPLTKATLQHLSKVFPCSVKFDDLVKIAMENVSAVTKQEYSFEVASEEIGRDLMQAFAVSMVALRSTPDPFVTAISDHPTSSALVRYQVQRQNHVTNLLHDATGVDILNRHIIELLDGSRTKAQLIDDVIKLIQAGKLNIQSDGVVLKVDEAKQLLQEIIDQALQNLGRQAVLIA